MVLSAVSLVWVADPQHMTHPPAQHTFSVLDYGAAGDGRTLDTAAINQAGHRYVSGVKRFELIVEKASERDGGNWGLWLDPMLSRQEMSSRMAGEAHPWERGHQT